VNHIDQMRKIAEHADAWALPGREIHQIRLTARPVITVHYGKTIALAAWIRSLAGVTVTAGQDRLVDWLRAEGRIASSVQVAVRVSLAPGTLVDAGLVHPWAGRPVVLESAAVLEFAEGTRVTAKAVS
jgi:hypothetical protein